MTIQPTYQPTSVLSLLLLCCSVQAATFEELAQQAAAARDADHVPQAVDLYRQALEQKPDWSEGWWSLGTLAYDSDQYALGQDAFTHLVKLDDHAPLGWSFLGLCEFETGDYAPALDHIQRGLALGANRDPATGQVLLFHQALLLTRAGLFDQAQRQFIPFARKGSRDPALMAGIGLAALLLPLTPKEIPPAQSGLIAKAGKAAYAWMAGDTASADEAFGDLLASYPSSPNVHYLHGAYLRASRPKDAVAEFQRELELHPHCAAAGAMIAMIHVTDDDPSGALPYAQQAAADGPTTPAARYAYGLLLSQAGDLRAIEHLEAAQRLDPTRLEYHMALAGAYSRFGRHEEARHERATSLAIAQDRDAHAQK